IELSGKYLSGNAYWFFEHDILDLGQRYTLTKYFEHLFDYISLLISECSRETSLIPANSENGLSWIFFTASMS
ncbi:hypothetical protein P691DRAFT_678981, partial [Macrolepiota fuliginosa MF-IS2]